MTLSASQIMDMFIRDEGLRLKPYRCTAGKLTIGIGRNLDDRGIDELEAHSMFWHDFDRCRAECEQAFDFWPELDEVRQLVLINMCFNLGLAGLKKFKNTLAAVKRGDYIAASALMLQSLWAAQVGARAARLAQMMETGVFV